MTIQNLITLCAVLCVYSIFVTLMFQINTFTEQIAQDVPLRKLNINEIHTTQLHLKSKNAVLNYSTARNSTTTPPFYPLNGTGRTVNIRDNFAVDRVNDLCETDVVLDAIVSVPSPPENFAAREAMRETIGAECAKRNMRMFFVVGASLDTAVHNKLRAEVDRTNDMVLVDKVDSYYHLHNKIAASLDWLIHFCPQPKYVIHIDDDFYPNFDVIFRQLRSIKHDNFIMGRIVVNAPPIRMPSHKWYVTKEEYPSSSYPTFIIGAVYAYINRDSVVLRHNLHAAEYCWVDDVWFLGHVREKAGLKAISMRPGYMPDLGTWEELRKQWKIRPGIHHVKDVDNFYAIYNETKTL